MSSLLFARCHSTEKSTLLISIKSPVRTQQRHIKRILLERTEGTKNCSSKIMNNEKELITL